MTNRRVGQYNELRVSTLFIFCSNLGMLSDMGVNDCLFNQFNWYVSVKGSVFRLYKKHVFVRHYLTEV